MTWFDHSPIKEHLSCFQYFSIVNKAAVNIFFNDMKQLDPLSKHGHICNNIC